MPHPSGLRRLPLAGLFLLALVGCVGPAAPSGAWATETAVFAAAQETPAAQPSATPVPLPTGTPLPTDTPQPTYTPEPSATPVPTDTPAPTATPMPTDTPELTATPAAPQPTAASAIAISIEVVKVDYSQWGRPAGMDEPGAGCGNFDDKRAVTMLSGGLRITNNSDKSMERWYGYFYDPAGNELYTCYYRFTPTGGFPALKPGETREVTFAVFSNDRVEIHGFVRDVGVGKSNEVTFPLQ